VEAAPTSSTQKGLKVNDNRNLKLVTNAALNDEEVRELGYRGLSIVRLEENESIYVACKNDDLIEYESGDLEVDTSGYKAVELPKLSDEVLLSPSVTQEEWAFLCETFGDCNE